MFLSSLLTVYAVDKLEPIALWVTIGLFAALAVAGTCLFLFKKEATKTFLKYAALGAFLYLAALAALFFSLDIAKHYSDSYLEKNWLDKKMLVRLVLVPLLVLSATCFVGSAACALLSKRFPEKKKTFLFALCALLFIALVVLVVCLSVYYDKKIKNDGYFNSDTSSVKSLSLYLFALLVVAAIALLAFSDKSTFSFDSRSVAYAGVCVAASFALSYIKLWDMPAGGSVTLVSLLPVMLYAYMFGTKKGVIVGFAYGVLQAVQDPWIIHPAQFLLDYPVAFSAAGLAGLFRNVKPFEKTPRIKFAFGAIATGIFRFISHVLSGALAFEAYAEGQNAWLYSLGYNVYVFIDVALVIVAAILLLSSPAFRKQIETK